MKKIKKAIEVVDVIEQLYKLQSSLDSLPKLRDKIQFTITIDSIGDLICLAEQYNAITHEPSQLLPTHWAIIDIAEDIQLHLTTSAQNYRIVWD